MIVIQHECLGISYETGLIKAYLSNGWIVKQPFGWSIDYDGIHIEYDTDAMEVIGAESVEEYSAEERTALESCEWVISDLKDEIYKSEYYQQAEQEYKASLDQYSYYGVSERDFY